MFKEVKTLRPTTTFLFKFSARVSGRFGAIALLIVWVFAGADWGPVARASSFDGPAELPRVSVPSAMAQTPGAGSLISVNAGASLQNAVASANCGDVIELQAGATFNGPVKLPAKNCDINHWILIRTSASNALLPAEGKRATPCYAGVSSLPGRPQYSCNNPQKVMATVQMANYGDGPFLLENGANYYRLVGLEITRPANAPGKAILIQAKGTADHIIIDRSWLHGNAQDETHTGISLSGMTNVAIIDSYFNDFHCISGSGQCVEGHAIGGGVGPTQDGPFKIQDNFLEGGGEGIMFGGGKATYSPSDIEILNNHFWKPWQWMKGNGKFVGGKDGNPFIVKNHLELKNAVRVLVEGNLMENVWAGFSQDGHAILLTPKSQHKGNTNVCPQCQVTDITIRYGQVSHAGAGIALATAVSGNGHNGGDALAGERWSIHDMVLDDLSPNYGGGGGGFEILNDWIKNPVNTITINHVTAFPDPNGHMMIVGNSVHSPSMYGLVFTNNLVVTGQFPVWNAGGSDSCAITDVPLTTFNKCFSSYTFSNNGLIAPPPADPPSSWPAQNMFPATVSSVGFTDFNNGNGGNYLLLSSSPYKGKGTDGKDLGADIVGLNQALANVE